MNDREDSEKRPKVSLYHGAWPDAHEARALECFAAKAAGLHDVNLGEKSSARVTGHESGKAGR